MLKITKMADYAIVILVAMADKAAPEHCSASFLSGITRLPEPTVAKVLKRMVAHDILLSVRGAAGGYKLSSGPQDITIEQIISAVDGPIALTACANDSENHACDYTSACAVKGRWNKVNAAVKGVLKNIKLSDMMPPEAANAGIAKEEKNYERL